MQISEHVTHLPEFPECRRFCMAYSNGKCKALSDTFFIKQKKKPCPFYKTRDMLEEQLRNAEKENYT